MTVSDEGLGFEPKELWRKDDRVTGGFGLFTIRERLALLGGRLEVESTPGRGSRFTLRVPREEAEELRPEEPEQVIAAADAPEPMSVRLEDGLGEEPWGGGRIRVLLADDHVVMRQGLSLLLQVEPDVEIVGEASNGEEAVELARRHRPDVVLMDASMPVMDGVEATRVISRELPEVRVVGLSMYDEADRGRAMLEGGARAYLSKAGPSKELLRVIREQAIRSGGAR